MNSLVTNIVIQYDNIVALIYFTVAVNLEVPGLHIGLETLYSEIFRDLPQSLKARCGIVRQLRSLSSFHALSNSLFTTDPTIQRHAISGNGIVLKLTKAT